MILTPFTTVNPSFSFPRRCGGDPGNDYHDQTIQSYIDEVKQYLLDGGCKPKVVNSPSSAGLIARGVLDLWTPTGAADFSPYFKSRAIQLALKDDEGVQTE